MVQEITTAITTVGFPIVACCGIFWFANKMFDKITSVISENTKAITILSEKMDSITRSDDGGGEA